MKRDFAVAVKAIVVRENKVLLLHRSAEEIKHSYMNNGICLEEGYIILSVLRRGF